MNKDEMYDAINKGIPNQIKLELLCTDLIKYCSRGYDIYDSIEKIRNDFERKITAISGYNKINHEFFDNLRLITNYKNSTTQIYVSPVCFIKKLKEIMNVSSPSINLDDENLLMELNNRLNVLNMIKDIDELREEFPLLFRDYKYSLILMDKIREKEKNNSEQADILRADYQKNGFDIRFNVFLANQKLMYKSLIDNAIHIQKYADNNPIKLENFKGLLQDKFQLYVAYRYLEYIKSNDNIKEKQEAIYYLTAYLNEWCGRYVSMIYNNREVSNVSLLREFRKILKDNRELKPVNESRNVYNSYHIKHVKNHINKYINNLENWCVLRISPNELLQNQQARIESLADYNMQNLNEKERDKKHLISLKYLAMLMRKLNFYENSNYELRLFGTGPFESHIAYFYPNGMVVVDKLYDESLDINPTYNEAIYVMDTNTFLNMATMDKPNLRENENVKRIFHSGDWEQRLMNEIEIPSINLNRDEANTLVSKFYQKKSK